MWLTSPSRLSILSLAVRWISILRRFRRNWFALGAAVTAGSLPASACVPAPGQGTVAIETREGDDAVGRLVASFDDPAARAAPEAERALVAALGGGCQTPIGALASPLDEETIELVAVVVALDGSRVVRGAARGPRREAAAIGARVAAQLIAGGANEILVASR